jgi:hypothetical protein
LLSVSQNSSLSSSVFSVLGPFTHYCALFTPTFQSDQNKPWRYCSPLPHHALHPFTQHDCQSFSSSASLSNCGLRTFNAVYHKRTTFLQLISLKAQIYNYFSVIILSTMSCVSTCPQPRTFIEETVQSPTCENGDCLWILLSQLFFRWHMHTTSLHMHLSYQSAFTTQQRDLGRYSTLITEWRIHIHRIVLSYRPTHKI